MSHMKKVVIVEDNRVVARIYQAKLQAEGFLVELAYDGESGLEMIRRVKPDLVLLDLMLPKISGVEILRSIRAESDFQAMPIIVFSSAYVSEKAMEAGATLALTKATYSPKQIVEEVRKILAADGAAQTPPAATAHGGSAAPRPRAPAPPPPAGVDADAEFEAGLRHTFFSSAPETLKTLRNSLEACLKDGGEPKHLADLHKIIHSIVGNAGLAGLYKISHVAATLEALLKELSEKPRRVTPSALRTVAQAVGLLGMMCGNGIRNVEDDTALATILVVDDEEMARRTVSYALGKINLRAICVGKSTTAFEVLGENRFDLICLDVDMPEMDGFELCAKLRTLPLHEKTPVLFVTTLSEFERRVQSGLSQGSDLIAKPFLYSELGVKALTFIIRGQEQRSA